MSNEYEKKESMSNEYTMSDKEFRRLLKEAIERCKNENS